MKKFLVHIIVVLTLAVALSATWIALAMPRFDTSHAASFGTAKNQDAQGDNSPSTSDAGGSPSQLTVNQAIGKFCTNENLSSSDTTTCKTLTTPFQTTLDQFGITDAQTQWLGGTTLQDLGTQTGAKFKTETRWAKALGKAIIDQTLTTFVNNNDPVLQDLYKLDVTTLQ